MPLVVGMYEAFLPCFYSRDIKLGPIRQMTEKYADFTRDLFIYATMISGEHLTVSGAKDYGECCCDIWAIRKR